MTREKLLHRSGEFLARLVYEVKVSNAMERFDINTVAEDFLIPILAIAYSCPDLANLNRIKRNFPAVDLGCETSRIAFQVTSDPSSSKFRESLEKFESHDLSAKFDALFIYVLTEKQRSYTSQSLSKAAEALSVPFELSKNILDFRDLAEKFGELSDASLQKVCEHLESAFGRADSGLKFRDNLEAFLSVSQSQIEDEKRTKKYIPAIFVETSETKEEMRYFANPLFFCRKIDDEIDLLNLDRFNHSLGLAKINPISSDLSAIKSLPEPGDLLELQSRLRQQAAALESIQAGLKPYSWSADKSERFQPSDFITGYWRVLRHDIESKSSGATHILDRIIEKIKIAESKIFLVTGMAGQGKTNFVCDLVENQFRLFEIPTIFIPARALNDYPRPNRILDFIFNNRYAPKVSDLHEVLALLNATAKECSKPFIIAIDGINEIGDLDAFSAELRVFLRALCQYDFVKVILTCRSEFFDHKFAGVFYPEFSQFIFRVENLRGEMTEENKARLLASYLNHFKIKAKLSKRATEFLKNDLLLLRIFAENHEGRDIGHVSDVYKGDIFADYLTIKIKLFPSASRLIAVQSIFKICAQMLKEENFSVISLEKFDNSERDIIEKLIGEDIILRREVPTDGFASLGIENISFTYDELRDFLLADYAVERLVKEDKEAVASVFKKLPGWPIREGFFRYAYILARKRECPEIVALCEADSDFSTHYLNNLSVLSPDIQSSEDTDRIRATLKASSSKNDIRKVAWFLFRKRELDEPLNVTLLFEHLRDLEEVDAEEFFRVMFSREFDFRDDAWRESVSGFAASVTKLTDEELSDLNTPTLALALLVLPYAHWEEREAVIRYFANRGETSVICESIKACAGSQSTLVLDCLGEIQAEAEAAN